MTGRPSRRERESGWLAGASVVAAALAYALVVLGTRTFDTDQFASISAVWTWWMVCAAAVTFPVQHWLIRTGVAGSGLRRGLIRSFGLVALVGVVAALLTVLAGDVWFEGEQGGYSFVVGLMPVGSWCVGWSRGWLALHRRMRLTATSIGLENLLRICFGVAVVLVGGSEQVFVWALPFGFLVAGLALVESPRSPISDGGKDVVGVAMLGGLAGASLVNQLVQSAGPLLVPLVGGDDTETTAVFVLLLLARVPYLLASTVLIGWTEHLTTLYVQGDRGALAKIIHLVSIAALAAAALVAVLGATVGVPLIEAAFGATVGVTRSATAVFAVASVTSVVLLILTLVLVAEGRAWHAFASSAVGAVLGGVVVAIGFGSALSTVAVGFLVATLAGGLGCRAGASRFLPDAAVGAVMKPTTGSQPRGD